MDVDSTPRDALDLAGRAIREFNILSGPRFVAHRKGWTAVPDAYECAAELSYIIAMLPQVVAHLTGSVASAAAEGDIRADGSLRDDDVDQVVQATEAALTRAASAVHVVAEETRIAREELSTLRKTRTAGQTRQVSMEDNSSSTRETDGPRANANGSFAGLPATPQARPRLALETAQRAIEEFDLCTGARLSEWTPGWGTVADLYGCVVTFAHLTSLLPTIIERMLSTAQATILTGEGPFDEIFGAEGAEVLMQEARDTFARASRQAIMLQAEASAAADLIVWAYDVGAAELST